VGEGRFKPEWMLDTLKNKERIPDSYVFPAKGLTLISVQYPPVEQYLSNYENYLAAQENSEDEG
jgi:tRNA pseudouridine38-40 synthase